MKCVTVKGEVEASSSAHVYLCMLISAWRGASLLQRTLKGAYTHLIVLTVRTRIHVADMRIHTHTPPPRHRNTGERFHSPENSIRIPVPSFVQRRRPLVRLCTVIEWVSGVAHPISSEFVHISERRPILHRHFRPVTA